MIWIEAIAAVSGVLCVWLMLRQNIWCWPVGLVQVSLYIFIFFEVKLYSDLILHVIYVILQIYGWHYWLHGGARGGRVEATRLRARELAVWATIAVAASAGWGTIMARATDAALPYADAFTMMTSLVAQWLITRKKVESWLFWIAIDVVAIGVFAAKTLYLTAGLYVVFLILAIAGYREWRKTVVPAEADGFAYEGGFDARKILAPSPGTPAGP